MSEERIAPADSRGRSVKREKRDVHGWCILDKPVGMTSTHAVSVVKRLFQAKRAGHAGTLDPLASGLLPIALGEATKTVPFVMDGRKTYRFTVRWGEERDTDDSEGRVTANSDARPTPDADPRAAAALHRHHRAGPAALLRDQGRRRARLRSRARRRDRGAGGPSGRHSSAATSSRRRTPTTPCSPPNAARAPMCARSPATWAARSAATATCRRCGAPASDRSRRRTRRQLARSAGRGTGRGRRPGPALTALLQPVDAGLRSIPSLGVSRADAARLARGQAVLLRGRDAPIMQGFVAVSTHGDLIALAEFEQGELRPRRIFNLGASG